MLTKSQLLQTLQRERHGWEALVQQVETRRMTVPGAAGYWSVKDLLSHIEFYEAWLVEWLEAALSGGFPAISVLDDPDIEQRNQAIFQLTHDFTLAQVLLRTAQTYHKLVDLLTAFPEDNFTDAEQTSWFMQPYWSSFSYLADAIANYTWEHYHEHLPDLQRWLTEGGR